ncbi:hypothetical protein D9615_001191 [Tricholomella constricta]|uniref:Uncharacterized protein n=1 Tax=Tricholomella constricta TaxID=117010 RepID=A0A8H5HL38_9AGAR|nr:hypothetical protein D9615_001191 [Tricholomella constricta]
MVVDPRSHERSSEPLTPPNLAAMTAGIETHGFPVGYFVVRNVATNRVLDVTGDSMEDGTEIILWPDNDTSLVETRRRPEANNQVFFIDTSGALCSRSSGHAVDIEGDVLVLRHRRPVSYPFPNPYAHPLPTFSYSPETGEISVHFNSDPSYSPSEQRADAWKSKSYVLTSIPLRKPKTIIDDAAAFLSSAISTPLSFLSGRAPAPHASPDEVFSGPIDLDENEVLEEDRTEEAEVDDSHDLERKVRMMAIVDKEESDKYLGEKAKNRRCWQVASLRRIDARTGGL